MVLSHETALLASEQATWALLARKFQERQLRFCAHDFTGDARFIVWGDNKATPLVSGTLASAREAKTVAARMLARLAARKAGTSSRDFGVRETAR